MGRRLELHNMICDKLASLDRWDWDPFNFDTDDVETAIRKYAERRVHYQPSSNTQLIYPCIVYKLDDMPVMHANNLPYHWDHAYVLTVIDRDPESVFREKIAELPMCKFQRFFVADNLNHYVFKIYY